MGHCPEPWEAASMGWIGDDHYEIIHGANGSVSGCEGLFREDAERICACVNAMAGIPQQVLNNGRFKIMVTPEDDHDGEQMYVMYGTVNEITEFCEAWLEEHGTGMGW